MQPSVNAQPKPRESNPTVENAGRVFSTRLLLYLTLAKFTIQYLFLNPAYQLHRDEYLYLDQGKHLAWGFLEVPPVISVLAWFTQLMGNNIFWVKFWPALFGALTLYVMGKTVQKLGGGTFALLLTGVCFIFSAYLRLNLLFQPNSLDILLWTLYFYLLIRFIQTNKNNYLYALGFALAIGLLNKYTVGFFIIGTLVGFLLTRYRQLFRQKVFYWTTLLTAVLVLPNLIWQLQHDLPFFTHMRELQERQLQHVALGDFLKDQIIMCIGALPVWPLGLGALFLSRWGKPYVLLGIIFLVVMGLLIGLQGKNYYTLGLYPILIAIGSVSWEKITQQSWQYWLRPVLLAFPFFFLFPVFPLVLPVLSPLATATYATKFIDFGILRWEDGQNHQLPQDYADMLGWQELTDLVAKAYAQIPPNQRQQTIILCDNYGQAGAINYYGRKANLPPAHAENASYLLWLPQPLTFRNVILVGDTPDPEHQKLFRSIKNIGRISDSLAREKGTSVIVLTGADQQIIDIVNNRIKEKKAVFGYKN
ncbi:glycosyltransferase family 39 protein [Adhaeribacter rhizoryzae]|uniref:Glycosyltransferase family 39 protein n=1 Tax=Adhaeribacter rhizoryzae TaxID=2607907 RepID=A0A5M6DGX6_9BACT|nr:glycosyltransferase family 39 protein [Adhaeribacter rhizoryzae]KAA5546673.1 glycosyltransferase family 39 protein [Adhaeribacter rhizoryzae]